MRRTLIEMLVMMLMTYIGLFLGQAILFGAFEFILLDGNINKYLLDLKRTAILSIIPSVGMGVKHLIDKYYV